MIRVRGIVSSKKEVLLDAFTRIHFNLLTLWCYRKSRLRIFALAIYILSSSGRLYSSSLTSFDIHIKHENATQCAYISLVCFCHTLFLTMPLKKLLVNTRIKRISNGNGEYLPSYPYIYNMRSAVRNTITINDKIKGTISDSLSALLG